MGEAKDLEDFDKHATGVEHTDLIKKETGDTLAFVHHEGRADSDMNGGIPAREGWCQYVPAIF